MNKLVYVINSLNSGGAEIQLVRVLELFKDNKKYDIEIITLLKHENNRLFEKLNQFKVSIFDVKKKPFDIFRILIKLKKFKNAIIHSHMYHSNILSRFSKILNHSNIIINSIHGEEEFKKNRLSVYKYTHRLVNHIFFVGKNLYKTYSRIENDFKKMSILYNGLDLKKYVFSNEMRNKIRNYFNIKKDDIVIINVGRFSKVKNQKIIINALSKINLTSNKYKLFLIGEGELKLELLELVDKLNLKESVFIIDFNDEIASYLSASDIFVLSSLNEGLPLVLQEACSVGLPIIATNVGSNFEFVDKNGFLIDINQDILNQKIIEMGSLNSDQINIMKYNSISISKKFDIERTCKKLINKYNSFLIN